MSTAAYVSFFDNGYHCVTVGHHASGYLQVVGTRLLNFLKSKELVNGRPHNRAGEWGDLANGSNCLFAQYVDTFKTELGNVYIRPSRDREYGKKHEAEIEGYVSYVYHVNVIETFSQPGVSTFETRVYVNGYAYREEDEAELVDDIFEGTLEEYEQFIKEWT